MKLLNALTDLLSPWASLEEIFPRHMCGPICKGRDRMVVPIIVVSELVVYSPQYDKDSEYPIGSPLCKNGATVFTVWQFHNQSILLHQSQPDGEIVF